MFNKPYDIVWMVGIVGAIIIIMGYGLDSALENNDPVISDEKRNFFNNTRSYMTDTAHLQATANDSASALTPDPGADVLDTDISIIRQGFRSMLAIPKTYHAAAAMMSEGTGLLGIPVELWIIMAGCIITTLFVILYTWIRGQS